MWSKEHVSEGLKRWTPRLAMLSLAFGSSVGVYRFSLNFYDQWIAFVVASSFELTYLGLAVVRAKMGAEEQRQALQLARTAAAVAMLYVTLDGLFHLRPTMLENKRWYVDLSLALVHGIPLPYVAYRMSNLILHASATPNRTQQGATGGKKKISGLRFWRVRPVAPVAQLISDTHDDQQPEQRNMPQLTGPTDRTLRIVKLWNEGKNQSQVSREVGLSRTSVANHLQVARQAGINVRVQGDAT